MAIRTGRKQFRALTDARKAFERAAEAAQTLSQNDPDRRRTAPLSAKEKSVLRQAAKDYRKGMARVTQLMTGKVPKYNRAVEARISEIFKPIGTRGRPKGSGRGRPRSK